MQTVSADFLTAVSGSLRPAVVVDAWYDGRLVYPNLPVESGSVSYDSTRSIQGTFQASIASPDGSLSPVAYDSPLAPYGSELHVRAGVANELVSLGWFRIDKCDPQESWAAYNRSDGTVRWVRRSVRVGVDCSDRLSRVDDFRMLSPEQPKQLASARQEIARLVRGVIPLGDLTGFADTTIPASIAYQESRLDALNSIADLMGAHVGMNPDGALTLWDNDPQAAPVWTVAVQANALSWSASQSRQGISNAVVARGDNPDAPVQGVAYETNGPLRWGGPFGFVPFGYASPLLTNSSLAQQAAATRLNTVVRSRVATVEVAVPANVALQLGDRITLTLPNASVVGVITAIDVDLPPATMRLRLELPLTALMSALSAGSSSVFVLPELTP